jgi:hypothetical protein
MKCPRCHNPIRGEEDTTGWKVSENEIVYLHNFCYAVIESEISHQPKEKRAKWVLIYLRQFSM